MNTPSLSTPACEDAPTGAPGPAQQAADAQYYRATLHGLIDLGTELAQAVHARAMRAAQAPCGVPSSAADDPSPYPDPTSSLTAAFDRVARTVRRTILLARHVAEPPPARQPGRTAARTQILRGCEDKIAIAAFHHRGAPGRIDTGALRAELLERLDAPELADALDHDVAARPVPEIVAEICRDLGLGLSDIPGLCPAPRRTPADIALLVARAAAPPGSPPRRTGQADGPEPESAAHPPDPPPFGAAPAARTRPSVPAGALA